jgi:hypothetical protein
MATSPTDDDPLSFYTKVPILRHRDVGDEHHGGDGGATAGVPREGAVRDGAAGVGAGTQAARGVRAAHDGLPLPVLPPLASDDAEDGLMANGTREHEMFRRTSQHLVSQGKKPLLFRWLELRKQYGHTTCALMAILYGTEIGMALLNAQLRVFVRRHGHG